ncbi:hypothetical protein [Halobaculum litoreum]|uniref:hypothetical protein n=1 Tax=Halobaculum litoreum TaxID=3031998 RepID=UPI0024C46ACB|nr:hypothetical protein [Halobaculum sp. DT92]
MSEQQSATRGQKDGILSDEEREVLSGSKGDNSTREALCEVLRERLRTALIDLEALYMWLPDDDLQAVFNPSERRETSAVRAASQEALSLLFIGMDMNGDVIEERITESLAYAGISQGEQIRAHLELVREPVADVDHQLHRLEDPDLPGPSLLELESLLYDDQVSPDRLAEVMDNSGWGISESDIRESRVATAFERIPQSIVTDVTVQSPKEND